MSRGVEKTALQAASLFGLILCVLTGIWAWQAGLLTSQERLQAFVASCGAAGGLLFVAFQMVQVVVPVLPGGLGCLVGVVLFGPVMGFVYNYVGICIGSLLLLCKQAAKIFQTICKKETALKRVLRNLLSAISFAQI